MPLQKLLDARAFDAETNAILSAAYQRVLTTLGIKDRTDPITRLIAETIVAMLDDGVTSRSELYERTIARFTTSQD